MKAKELIRILNAVGPESDVLAAVQCGGNYRELCAKAEIVTGECLSPLTVESVEILGEEGGCEMFATLNLSQVNVDNLCETAELFDRLYQRREGVKNPYEE